MRSAEFDLRASKHIKDRVRVTPPICTPFSNNKSEIGIERKVHQPHEGIASEGTQSPCRERER